MKRRVEIQVADNSSNDFADTIQEWDTVLYRWASIEPAGSRLTYYWSQVHREATHRVTLLYDSGLWNYLTGLDDAGLQYEARILYGDRVLDITSIHRPDEEKQYIELACNEMIGEPEDVEE